MIKVFVSDDKPKEMTLIELIHRIYEGKWTPNPFYIDVNRHKFTKDEYGRYFDQDGDCLGAYLCYDCSNLYEKIWYDLKEDEK